MPNFIADAKQAILAVLPYDHADQSAIDNLRKMDEPTLFVYFFNYINRLIHPRVRQVFISNEYNSRHFSDDIKSKVSQILTKIRNGTELTPHLSEKIDTGYSTNPLKYSSTKLQRKRHLDLLLNDWGIHHLHISNDIEPNGFVTRDGPLLFIIFTDEIAYILDLYLNHGDWSNQNLVEIAVKNWPEARLFCELVGALGMEKRINTEERKELRSAGIDTPIEVNGKVFISATYGISSSGISTTSSLRAQNLFRTLFDLDQKIEQNPEHLDFHFALVGLRPPHKSEFHTVITNTPEGFHFGLQESNTGFTIIIKV